MKSSNLKPIVFLIPNLDGGGAQRVFVNLVNSLIDLTERPIHLLVLRRGGVFESDLRPEVVLVNLGTGRVSRSFFSLVKYIKESHPEVLCSTLNYCNILAIAACIFAGRPCRVVVREANVATSAGRLLPLMRWFYPKADVVVSLSSEVTSSFVEADIKVTHLLVELGNPIKLNPLIVSIPDMTFLPEPNSRFICSVGSLTYQKGFDILLEAFAKLDDHELHLVMLGEGELREELEQIVSKLGISERVHMPGFVDRPADIVSRSQLFVLSSRWEGFPNVLLEALSTGVPIVATSCPGASSSMLEGGKLGLLVEPNSPSALAEGIIECLKKPPGSPELRRSRAREFSADIIAKKYLDEALIPVSNDLVFHIISGLNDGGAESVLHRLSTYDNSKDHHVISMMGMGKYGSLLVDSGVRVTCLDMPAGRVSLSGLIKLYRLIKQEKPTVIQTWMYHADLVGGLIGRLAGAKKVFWNIRHSELEPGKTKRTTILVAKLCAVLSKWIPHKIICCAEKAKSVHVGYGYDASKMVVIENGYDLARNKPDIDARVHTRFEFKMPSENLLLGMVGRFNVQKNHYGLLESLAHLKKRGLDFKCLLVGNGMDGDNEELVNWVKHFELVDQVKLLGQRSDVPEIMNALDIHLFSSAFGEGFPNVLAEAMACGTPCVTTNAGDAEAIVGDTGWVVPVRDSENFANAVLAAADEWLNQPSRWKERQARAVQRVHQNFSLEKMVQSYQSVWRIEAGKQ